MTSMMNTTKSIRDQKSYVSVTYNHSFRKLQEVSYRVFSINVPSKEVCFVVQSETSTLK